MPLSGVQMRIGKMPRSQLAQVNEWKHRRSVSRPRENACSCHLRTVPGTSDSPVTELIAHDTNSSFFSFSHPELKGGWEGIRAENGSFCTLSEGMMGLFLLQQVHEYAPPNLIRTALQAGQHKTHYANRNGNNRWSNSLPFLLICGGWHSNLFTSIL